jgi:alpha,alpha-trehalase
MPKPVVHDGASALRPGAVLVVSQRPRPGLGRILPTLEALGVPAVTMLARQIGETFPPPFHNAPHEVAVLAIDADSVRVAWRAGAGLVAGLGSGQHGLALREAGAERLVEAPSELGSGHLLDAFAEKFATLPSAAPALAALRGAAVGMMFDFDGTLAPVPRRPADGYLPPATRELLTRLSTRHPLAVVSGRGLEDLAARVALPVAYLAGNHGFELRAADYDTDRGAPALAPDWRTLLDAVHVRLMELLEAYPGCEIEHKGATLAVHYRAIAPGTAPGLRREVVRVVAGFERLIVETGRQVLEIRPAIHRDKGTAVHWLNGRMQRVVAGCTPIFFGDDRADEAAFRAARRAGGFGVLIAEQGRPTAASCRLDSPAHLAAALETLLG